MATPKEAEAQSFAKQISNEVVTFEVGVGDSKRVFTIRKDILCKKAPLFDTMFNGPFKEGSTQTAVLDEDYAGVFELFVAWVYLGEIHEPLLRDETLFIGLIIFSDKYELPALANKAMDVSIASFAERGKFIGIKQMDRGYRKTLAGSKLRLFISRLYVYLTLNYRDEQTQQN